MNQIVDYRVKHCFENNISNILIRELTEIKQKINNFIHNNQNFVHILFGTSECKFKRKCTFYGIKHQLVDQIK